MLAVGLAVTAAGAVLGQEAPDALWTRTEPDWLPRLGTALDAAPGGAPDGADGAPGANVSAWADPRNGVSGRIAVFPADGAGCRRFRVEVTAGSGSAAGTGTRCRDPDGTWLADAGPDRVAAVDVALRDLQRDLRRLRYFVGPADGLMSPALDAAIRRFMADEAVPAGTGTAALRDRAAEAVARIPPPGRCPDADADADADADGAGGRVVVCARVR